MISSMLIAWMILCYNVALTQVTATLVIAPQITMIKLSGMKDARTTSQNPRPQITCSGTSCASCVFKEATCIRVSANAIWTCTTIPVLPTECTLTNVRVLCEVAKGTQLVETDSCAIRHTVSYTNKDVLKQQEASLIAQAETRAQAQAEAQAKTDTLLQAQVQAQAQMRARAQAQAKAQSQAREQIRVQAQAEAQRQALIEHSHIQTQVVELQALKVQSDHGATSQKVSKADPAPVIELLLPLKKPKTVREQYALYTWTKQYFSRVWLRAHNTEWAINIAWNPETLNFLALLLLSAGVVVYITPLVDNYFEISKSSRKRQRNTFLNERISE
jgi:hypothetical protein